MNEAAKQGSWVEDWFTWNIAGIPWKFEIRVKATFVFTSDCKGTRIIPRWLFSSNVSRSNSIWPPISPKTVVNDWIIEPLINAGCNSSGLVFSLLKHYDNYFYCFLEIVIYLHWKIQVAIITCDWIFNHNSFALSYYLFSEKSTLFSVFIQNNFLYEQC